MHFAKEEDRKNMDYLGGCILMAIYRNARIKFYSMLDEKSNELSEEDLIKQKLGFIAKWKNAVSDLRDSSAEERYRHDLETVVQFHRR